MESGVKYIKRGFVPLREFRDLTDANRQLHAWVMDEAGNRTHGTTRKAPLKRFAEVEKAQLAPLPVVPPELATWAKVKVHRDAHVQYEHNYYSVPFRLAGAQLWLKATGAMVTLYREHEAIAIHVRATGRATGTYERRFAQLVKVPLLICDDFGLKPLRSPEDEDFHDLIAERYERTATVLTSNLDFSEWGEAFASNKMIGAATLDRLRHAAYRVVLDGESYRSLKAAPETPKTRVAKQPKIAHS